MFAIKEEAMLYISSRNKEIEVKSSEAILKGISPDGGLFIPKTFPKLDLEKLIDLSYQDLAVEILKLFLTDFTDREIKCSIYNGYDEKFSKEEIVNIKYLKDTSILELFHGSTLAFKDMALSVLPFLMKKAAKRKGIDDEIIILTATSGDTGKAALEGFADVDGIKIIVFYPSVGISDIQKKQMVTQSGENVYVFGIEGNFDDAQRGVKEVFLDENLKETLKSSGYVFSSANSINIGRLIPQIVYYVYGYLDFVRNNKIKLGDKINVAVPTGNFGNILAGRYAKEIGLPINKFICASNENNILSDFINTGIYDLNRKFKITNSPSMDILISSNLERFLSLIGDNTKSYMEELISNKKYTINKQEKENMKDFYGGFATEKETLEVIKKTFENENYILDTHTAVAKKVYENYVKETNDFTETIIVSTASPFKFTRNVLKALDKTVEDSDDFELIEVLSKYGGLEIPESIKGLSSKKVLHPYTIKKSAIKDTIKAIL